MSRVRTVAATEILLVVGLVVFVGAAHLVEVLAAGFDRASAGCADALTAAGRGPRKACLVRGVHNRLAIFGFESNAVGEDDDSGHDVSVAARAADG